jgi:pseudouridine synthase
MKIIRSSNNSSIVEITIHQGRKRQVRRMLKLIGHPVMTLERISFGGITIQDIPMGAYRPLKTSEVKMLKKLVNLE